MINHRSLFAFLLILMLFMLSFSVVAQEPDITPTPRPSTATVITEVSEAVQTNSNALGILVLVVIILGIIVVIFLVVAWKGLQPLIKALTDANQERNKLQEKVFEMITTQAEREVIINQTRQMQSKSLEATAKQQETTAKLMVEIETKHEAQTGRVGIISNVNEHMDNAVKALNSTLETAVHEISELKTELQNKVSKDDLSDGMKPILDKLDSMSGRITAMSGELSELRTALTSKEIVAVTEEPPPLIPKTINVKISNQVSKEDDMENKI